MGVMGVTFEMGAFGKETLGLLVWKGKPSEKKNWDQQV
jgi:hypothetical protein